MNKSKYIVIGSIIIILIISFIYVLLTPQTIKESIVANTQQSTTTEIVKNIPVDTFGPLHVPEGWKVYVSSNEWSNGGRIAFAYPDDWSLEEKFIKIYEGKPNEGVRLEEVVMKKSDLLISINRKGRHADSEITIKNINGYEMRSWNSESNFNDDHKYFKATWIKEPDFIISALSSDDISDTFNLLLSTMDFESSQK